MKTKLTIGHLPILDHLILGVADQIDGPDFEHISLEPKCFDNWDALASALEEGSLSGAFILFPLAEELFRRGNDLKIVLLGHREGQVLTVENTIQNVSDLRGKSVVVPHRYSTHHLLLHEILKNVGLTLGDIKLKVGYSNIREATDQLVTGETQAFMIAEPMGTEAKRRGIGKILALSQEVKTHHVDCVLVLRSDTLKESPEACQELIDSLVRAGMYINAYPRHASEAGQEFLGFPTSLLREAISHDRGHILFWDLLPRLEDFVALQQIALEIKLWEEDIDLEPLIYGALAQKAYREWSVEIRQETQDKGERRTLPGNFQEATNSIQKLIGPFEVRAIRFIRVNSLYPKGVERKNFDLSQDLMVALGIAEIVLTSQEKGIKGIHLFERGSWQPDKILLCLDQKQAELCWQALHFGEHLTLKDNFTSRKELFKEDKKMIIFPEKNNIVLVLSYEAYCFLALILVQDKERIKEQQGKSIN